MCGIIGYVGSKNATPFLIRGLEDLEYRGYDSAGLYVSGQGALKKSGRVAELKRHIPEAFSGRSGIAHTRWATHGPPTEQNAHPHTDAAGRIWLVHNGIVENHAELRSMLEQQGVTFRSETDTEVLAQLIGKYHLEGLPLYDATTKALSEIRGTYAIAVASTAEPDTLIAARLGSPLLLGVGEDGYYIASDAAPILPHTRKVIYLLDGEIALLTQNQYRISTIERVPVEKKVETLDWDVAAAQKQGYEHFMLKEMMEIPEVIENTLRGRLKKNTIELKGLQSVAKKLSRAKRIIVVGCGSAYYAGLVGELLIEELTGIPVEVEVASEFRYRRFTAKEKGTILIAVSQSGETADTLEAVREAKRNGLLTLGIVNVIGSSVARETDAGVYNHAGPEIGVASTKAFISQLTVFALLALYLRILTKSSVTSEKEHRLLVRELAKISEYVRSILERRSAVEILAKKYASIPDALYIGRKFQYPIAYEGALKLKEISYIHAEAYGAGEMKHGPLALVEPGFLTVALMPHDELFEKTRSNVAEIKARDGRILAITTDDVDLRTIADDSFVVPKTFDAFLSILTTIPLQLFAYYVAKERGLPIDKPRNLAKSVTVE